jgi:hypothetical protein
MDEAGGVLRGLREGISLVANAPQPRVHRPLHRSFDHPVLEPRSCEPVWGGLSPGHGGMRILGRIVFLMVALLQRQAWAADEIAPNRRPVKVIADSRLAVGTQGSLPLYVSSDWSMPLPGISRAVLVLHGRLRDADVYYRSAKTAQTAAGEAGQATIMIVPQFLAGIDVDAYHLPADTLRWSLEGWEGATRPAVQRRQVRSKHWMRSWPGWPTGACSPT